MSRDDYGSSYVVSQGGTRRWPPACILSERKPCRHLIWGNYGLSNGRTMVGRNRRSTTLIDIMTMGETVYPTWKTCDRIAGLYIDLVRTSAYSGVSGQCLH